MTTKRTTKRTTRRRAVKPAPQSPPAPESPAPAPEQPFVNRVVLDNTVPEGFRYERVLCRPGVTG